MSSTTLTLTALNSMDRHAFVTTLADIFEHSSWIAEAAWPHRPFGDIRALHAAMVAAVDRSPVDRQLDLIRAHPDLAGKAARSGALTTASTGEQRGAGLDRLNAAEFDRFHALNTAYRDTFGFPFVIAVKGLDKTAILDAFERRLKNDADGERMTALGEIAKIARFRLEALFADP